LNIEQKDIRTVQGYPDYAKDFEVLGKEEAKNLFREFEHAGLVHMVFSQTPFITGMCNCDSTYCGALRARSRYGSSLKFMKSEYVSTVDWEKCNGCRECMKLCNFGAISYSPAVGKCYIDQIKCCGSGLCRSACLPKAITMRDRTSIPALAKAW
jgi:heterodisulfide reductase subunit A-like polyferredoxin